MLEPPVFQRQQLPTPADNVLTLLTDLSDHRKILSQHLVQLIHALPFYGEQQLVVPAGIEYQILHLQQFCSEISYTSLGIGMESQLSMKLTPLAFDSSWIDEARPSDVSMQEVTDAGGRHKGRLLHPRDRLQ